MIGGDVAKLNDSVIKSFLSGVGFVQDVFKKYSYDGAISEHLVTQIADFFEEYDEELEMDRTCAEYRRKRIMQMQDFEAMRTEGLHIKNTKYSGQLDIPMMGREKSLKPYQIMPVRHALALGNVANFSVPGSGKTWMAYSSYFLLKYSPKTEEDAVKKLLVIGPLSSFRPWETEYREMTDREANSVRISGNRHQRREIFEEADKYEIFLASYAIAAREKNQIIDMLQKSRFMVVVDESHHIKNPHGEYSMAIRDISKFAHKRMILTGTAVPNTLEDLWSQFTFIHPNMDVLGTLEQFRYDLANQNGSQYLNARLDPFFVRVSKSTLNLPVATMARVTVPMGRIQSRIYSTIAGHIRVNDQNLRSDMVAMRRWRKNSIMYLLEAATDPSLLTKSTQFNEDPISGEGLPIQELLSQYQKFEIPGKMEAVRVLAERNLEQRKKIIVWCSFIATIKKLENILKRFEPLTIYGEIPRDDAQDENDNRELRIEKFKTSQTNNVLIANPASLAESISLHRVCHHAIYVDRTFNGGNYLQSLERIHRIGMDPHVKTKYTIFMSENTIDYDVDARLEIKKRRMQSFLDDDAFETVDIDLMYNEPIGPDAELDEDYKAILKRLQGSQP